MNSRPPHAHGTSDGIIADLRRRKINDGSAGIGLADGNAEIAIDESRHAAGRGRVGRNRPLHRLSGFDGELIGA